MAEPGKADRLALLGQRRRIERVFGQRFIGAAVAGGKQEIGEDRAEGIALARFGLRLSNRIAKPLRRAVELGRSAIAVHLGLRWSHREERHAPPDRKAQEYQAEDKKNTLHRSRNGARRGITFELLFRLISDV